MPMRILLALALASCAGSQSLQPPPAAQPGVPPPSAVPKSGPAAARTVDVVETRFGIEVKDPYRWMEGHDNAELRDWLLAQNDYTRAQLSQLSARDQLFERIRSLGLSTSAARDLRLAGGRQFYMQIAPGEQLLKLVVRDAHGERVLVDPAQLSEGERHASLNSFAPSPDGKLVAYDLALGGGEISTIRVVDASSCKELPDRIEHIWGELAASWLPDGKGFFYTQMAKPEPGVDPMLHMLVRLHMLGTAVDQDQPVLGSTLPSAFTIGDSEFPSIFVSPGTSWAVAVGGGAHSEGRFAVAPLAKLDRTGKGQTPWRVVAELADQVEWVDVHGDRLYMQTFKDAGNRKLISVPLTDPVLAKARVEIAEDPDATLVWATVARDALYIQKMVDGRARLLRWAWPGKGAPQEVKLPFDGWIDNLASEPTRDGAQIDLKGWTKPAAFYTVDVQRVVAPTGVASVSAADYAGIIAEEVTANSRDGTQVPLTILRQEQLTFDGSHPALLHAYGGYGNAETPSFDPTRQAWIERGGVYAICHVRGGGEKGHAWQVAGTHEHKLNGVHDFEACGQYLIDHRFTSPQRLSASGRSMGGVLIGRAITDRPDLFAAATIGVGIVNPLRILAATNGENQKVELGDPDTEQGFRSILEMDPYQHVTSQAYPGVLFTVGINDARVAPWMTGKMAAKLQAATTSGRPVLVRVDTDAGHGIGSTRDQAFAERADVYSFFLQQSGDPAFARSLK